MARRSSRSGESSACVCQTIARVCAKFRPNSGQNADRGGQMRPNEPRQRRQCPGRSGGQDSRQGSSGQRQTERSARSTGCRVRPRFSQIWPRSGWPYLDDGELVVDLVERVRVQHHRHAPCWRRRLEARRHRRAEVGEAGRQRAGGEAALVRHLIAERQLAREDHALRELNFRKGRVTAGRAARAA